MTAVAIRSILSTKKRWRADLVADGPVGRLHATYDHLYIRSLDHAIDKLVRYARWGAQQLFLSGKRVRGWEILIHPAWRFFRDYFVNLGILDGSRGVVVVLLHTGYTLLKYVKLWELQRTRAERPSGQHSRPRRAT
ncbi:MAG TPA: hypothetical protein VF057_12055 [Thermoanaerobaculia bacterium]